MNPKALLKSGVVYLAILALFSLVIAYQIKSSLDTVRVERTLQFFVPFTFEPFTNRIDNKAHVLNWEEGAPIDPRAESILHRGDEILSVNGHAFRGLSVYVRTLVYDPSVWHASGWHGFNVMARLADSTVHRVDFGFPQCTCGIPSLADAVSVWFVPPIFCVLLGFATALWRPRAVLAWGFLGALLALSQVQFWDDLSPGFWSVTSTPMAWGSWFRWFGVGYRALVQAAWPAALLIASIHFYPHRRLAVRFAVGSSALVLTYAMLRVLLQLAWSEDYRPFVGLYRFLDSYETEFVALAFVAVAVLGWILNWRLGLGSSVLALITIATMYLGAPPVTHGDWVDYSDGTRGVIFDIPTVHNTPAFAVALFVGGVFALALLIFRRQLRRLETFGCLLLLPLLLDFAARAGRFWYPLEAGPFRYWYCSACAVAGSGLLCLFWSILHRTSIKRSSRTLASTS